MKQALLVLGMHRSGTSSVAGALSHLGAAAPATLMSEHPDNPKGYWESLPLVQASDRILHSAGSSWCDWRPFNPAWRKSATGKEMVAALPDLVASEFGGQALITIKDPRLCRLFPIWEAALKTAGYQPLVITPLRSPIEVAASLSRRDGFSQSRGLLLWLRHVLDAESSTRQTPRHFMDWSDFLHDWRGELARATDQLGVSLPAWSDFTADTVDRFLDVQLRRLVHEREFPSQTPDWVKTAWEAVRTLQQDPTSSVAQDTLDEVRQSFDSTAKIYGPVLVGLEGERLAWNTDLQAQLAVRTSELADACRGYENERTAHADTHALLQDSMTRERQANQQREAESVALKVAIDATHQLEARLNAAQGEIARQAEELREQSDASLLSSEQLKIEIDILKERETELESIIANDKQSAFSDKAELVRQLTIFQEAETTRLALPSWRRWLK